MFFKQMFDKYKKKSESEKVLDTLINDMKLYLENNYKDLAIQSRKEAIALLQKAYDSHQLTGKQYQDYKKVLDEYTQEMKNYNHQEFYHS